MEPKVNVMIVCFFSTFRYSDSVTDCCHITRMEWESHVFCSGCLLKDVPQDLPITTTVLNLKNNNIEKLDNNSITHLSNLETLVLANNGMHSISPGAFATIENLEYLDLSENYFEPSSFDSSVFKHLHKLTVLYLHSNMFHLKGTYPENAISSIKSLNTLSIDIFEGFVFGMGFLNLTKLKNLHVNNKEGKRVSIRNTSFEGLKMSNISHLQLHFEMKKIEAGSLSPFHRLVSLELDSKRTVSIHEVLLALEGLRERKMESIKLTSNHYRYTVNGFLEKSDIVFLGTICVRKLNLAHNLISGITMEAVLAWKSRSCLEVLNISTNAIISGQLLTLLVLFPSITHVYASYEASSISRKRRQLMHREQTFFIPSSLLHLELSHNPFGGDIGNIWVSKSNNLNVLDISYPFAGFKCSEGRIKGLVNLTEFYVSGIECSHPNDQMFADMRNLSRLEAKECNLGKRLRSNKTSLFKGLYNLSFIDLTLNDITSFNSNTFIDQSYSLETLVLNGNDLDHLPLESLKNLNALKTLDVRNNHISTLSERERSFLDTYVSKSENFIIELADNPLVCSCDNLEFLVWFHKTKLVHNRKSISCSTNEGDKIRISEFLESVDEFRDSCVAQFWLLISVSLALLGILVAFLSRVAWKQSVLLRTWCREPLVHKTCDYDMYICYGNEDARWVRKLLVPWLEKKGITFCCDDKDFDLCLDLADNIMNAIDNSRQTVFVVSYKFLEHKWPMFAMGIASYYSFRKGHEDMNIIIRLDDIKRSEFPILIRKNWDVICPLKWPNENNTYRQQVINAKKIFWKQLLKRFKLGNASQTSVCETNVSKP
ncbi:toll-like receptor 2 [Ylistrum balloti]|uniref:toll-like receptor 2 n=1 Tax=Ylistrum balloti TaxID=509963 RepID=UPI002905CB9C|nr:toll-like receptor 2 [Ylistrum balloti]